MKFCSFCGTRVQDQPEQEFRFSELGTFEEPKPGTGASFERYEAEEPAAARESVAFDWSNVMDEPHRKEIPDVRSPWASSGGIDEKELYAEMTPSTERSRTMSFIDVLKAEKEEKEKRAEEKAFEYTEVLEIDHDMSAFNEAPQMHFAPLYKDVDEPVKTPFDDIPSKSPADDIPVSSGRQSFEFSSEPAFSASKETIAQFDEYVRSFEAGLNDEPRFEKPEPAREEPVFELPDFLKRAAEPSKAEPAEEPAFKEPKYDEPKYDESRFEEPVFEEPKYEETRYEDLVLDEGPDEGYEIGFDDEKGTEDLYLDMDTGRSAVESRTELPEEETVDEEALFEEMRRDAPEKKGMTIAPPADKESEIEALRNRLAELMGTEEAEPAGKVSSEEKSEPEPAEKIALEPETTADIDEYFAGLTPARETKPEPAAETPELLVLEDVRPEPATAEAVIPEPVVIEEIIPEPVVLEAVAPAPAVPETAAPEPVVIEEITPEPVVLETVTPEPVVLEAVTPAPAVPETAAPAPAEFEEVKPAPAPAVPETVTPAPEPAPAVPETTAPAPAATEQKKVKSSDALSLEDLEKDLFGESMSEEAEAEETKKIDKFYTLYRKNEEFQRLLDEEYDKLKGDAPKEAAKPEAEQPAEPAPVQEIPAENSKAYRQIEDETIYKAFELPPELVKAPPKEVPATAVEDTTGKRPVEALPAGAADKKELSKAEAKAEARAAKAKARAEKKAAKAKAKAETVAAGAEYEEVDTGSGFLTVLAVIIAIILVILLAIILILQIAPDSSIAIAIDSFIERLTGGFSSIDPGSGQFLL